jgi:HemY protein
LTMVKLLWRFALLLLIGIGFAWLADRPGSITIRWLGREVEMSVVVAAVVLLAALALLLFFWGLVKKLWRSPKTAREYLRFRKHRKGYESLSRGIIAAGAGDAHNAHRHATAAAGALTDEPLVALLAAQAAQLKGDKAKVREVFEGMAKSPDTELLGLRGLFSEAQRSGDLASALKHAERALALNPRLPWASSAVLQVQTARKNWEQAALTLDQQGRSGLLPKEEANRKRAALLAAEALGLEDTNREQAFSLASKAHDLDPALVPATLVMARAHIANGNVRKATKLLRGAWEKSPHPDIAELMGRVQPDAGPEDRFEKVRDGVGSATNLLESSVALARAAIAAQRFDVARDVLSPFTSERPQARVCVLMAQVENAAGDKGRSREWLARAIHAPRDPMWVSDGVANLRWVPVSPVTGEIVPCEWKVPFDMLPQADTEHAAGEGAPALLAKSSTPADVVNEVAPPAADDPGIEN